MRFSSFAFFAPPPLAFPVAPRWENWQLNARCMALLNNLKGAQCGKQPDLPLLATVGSMTDPHHLKTGSNKIPTNALGSKTGQ